MRSGRLRHLVSLQIRQDSQQPGGQVVHSYVETAKIWANVSPLSGREFFAAQQVNSEITTKITVRFRPEIDSTYRIVHTVNRSVSPPWTDVYDVLAVVADEKTNRRELALMCVRRVAEGWRSGITS